MNKDALHTLIRLKYPDTRNDLLPYIKEKEWRLDFYFEYGYLNPDKSISEKFYSMAMPGMYRAVLSWSVLEDDLVHYILQHPEIEI